MLKSTRLLLQRHDYLDELNLMYIIAIAWLYVAAMMAGAEPNLTASFLTFTFYGALPCALLLWLLGVKHRTFKKQAKQQSQTEQEREP